MIHTIHFVCITKIACIIVFSCIILWYKLKYFRIKIFDNLSIFVQNVANLHHTNWKILKPGLQKFSNPQSEPVWENFYHFIPTKNLTVKFLKTSRLSTLYYTQKYWKNANFCIICIIFSYVSSIKYCIFVSWSCWYKYHKNVFVSYNLKCMYFPHPWLRRRTFSLCIYKKMW